MWEALYRKSDAFLFGRAPALLLTENPWLVMPGTRGLCVADGEGRNSVHLAAAGMQMTAFDPSPTALRRARELAAEAGVTVDAHLSDWQGWDWSQRFDMVVGIFIQFADPAFRARQFADMARALRPGGRLVLHGYTPEQLALGTGGPSAVEHLYSVDLLRAAFAGWRIERLAAYEREVQEGRAHVGHSALIDLVARKPGAE